MKKIMRNIMLLLLSGAAFSSCHKLDVPSTTELTSETFPKTEAHFNALMGTIYTLYRNDYATNHFFVSSQSTNESVLPMYATDWWMATATWISIVIPGQKTIRISAQNGRS